MVDGGQADVLVAAAVAGDEVGVEQLVVVAAVGVRAHRRYDAAARDDLSPPESAPAQADRDVVVGGPAGRVGVARDVVEEGVAGARRRGGADGRGRVALHEPALASRAAGSRSRRA